MFKTIKRLLMAMPFAVPSQLMGDEADFVILDPAYEGFKGSKLQGLNAYIMGENRLSDICRELYKDNEHTYMDAFCTRVSETIEVDYACIEKDVNSKLVLFPYELAEQKPDILHEEFQCALERSAFIHDIFRDHDLTMDECENLSDYECTTMEYPINGQYNTVTYAFSLEP